MNTVNRVIIERLFDSFNELERAILSARKTLEAKAAPPVKLLDRIRNYEEILDKQRDLATSLCGHAALGNWQEVSRHIRLINGLSTLIRDDAREILSENRTPRLGHHCEEPLLC